MWKYCRKEINQKGFFVKRNPFFSMKERVNLSSLQKIHLNDCDLTKSMLQSPYIDVRFVLQMEESDEQHTTFGQNQKNRGKNVPTEEQG